MVTNPQLSSVPHFPIEDEKLRAKSITRRRGGNTANSLEAAQNTQSTDLHLLAVLPNEQSASSKFICESLPQVNISNVSLFRKQHQEAASSYIIQSEENRSRTIVSINQLPEMRDDEFMQQVHSFTGGKEQGWKKAWYHFEGRVPEITLLCVRFLRDQFPHFNISVECEKPERTGMAEVAEYADVVFYSKLWAEKNGYTDARSFLEARRSETRDGAMLCCTWGSGGATAVQKGDDVVWADVKAWQAEGDEQAKVVDTIGAGDTFIAGMLFAINEHCEWSLQRKLEFANGLAGRKVLQEGFGGLGKSMW
ncbi:Ribokinase-like protein [Clathrospora elynae]|uniref:Ribokinase-like protein n=1 Tax=Clathrospora elynae TaxID=706981 RepID=A0A6A5S839_9PLEO|nr:Ribokinase-like protein [Clathrospora elynae]